MVSETFDAKLWAEVPGFEFTDITYHRAHAHGTVRIAFDRPDVRNAFRPRTVDELYRALDHARMSTDVGCVILTGNGPSAKDGGWAFCSGGDQRIRGRDGYKYAEGDDAANFNSPHLKPDHGATQTHFPASQAPFRLQLRADVHGPTGGAGAGAGAGGDGGGGVCLISLVSAGTMVVFARYS